MKGWFNKSYEHSLASRGIRSKRIKYNCIKPIPVYRGIQIDENKPIDLRNLPKMGWWTTDSRVAVLFSARPKNERLNDMSVVEVLERNILLAMDEERDPNPRWLDRWLNDVAYRERYMMDIDKYGILLRSNIKKGDNVKKGNTLDYLLEQEVYVQNDLDILEVGFVDTDSEPVWINYNDIPEEALKDSNEFRHFMNRHGTEKEIKDEIPEAVLLSLMLKLSYDLREYRIYGVDSEIMEKALEDVIDEDFWKYQCDTLPKYEGVFND